MVPITLFLIFPAAEIFLFIEVANNIGAWSTLGLIFGSAILGGFILRLQGQQVIRRARAQMAKKELPTKEIADGVILVIAAIFLLTPGFITDGIGTLLIIPIVRRVVFILIFMAIKSYLKKKTSYVRKSNMRGKGPIIEGKFEDISNTDNQPKNPNIANK